MRAGHAEAGEQAERLALNCRSSFEASRPLSRLCSCTLIFPLTTATSASPPPSSLSPGIASNRNRCTYWDSFGLDSHGLFENYDMSTRASLTP